MILILVAWLCFAAAPQEVPLPEGVKNTQKPADVPLPPAEAAKLFKVPEGFRSTLFAAEPDVMQPIALAFDDRGRLWVAECYSYPKWKEPGGRDRIVIFEDADGDGRFDTRKVFWDKARNLTGILPGFGGVWACSTPNLIFIPDRNGDDKPDGDPEVILDGWNDNKVGHNVFNGLLWGPDGWLYGEHGIQGESKVGPPGTPDAERTALNCSVWRWHPVRKIFEVVCHGTTNPWGLDFDEHGEMFFVNCVIGHLWHVVPGAHYKRMYGKDYHPFPFELADPNSDHLHWKGTKWNEAKSRMGEHKVLGGGHAHAGAAIYLGDNWPDKYRNSIFMGNVHGRRLNQDRLERKGSGYAGTHAEDLFTSDDPWFRCVSLQVGPEGGMWVADWNDLGECHDNDGVHRNSGRIYRIVHGEPKKPGPFDLSKLPDAELVKLQIHKNDWWVRHARRLLQERAAAGKEMGAVHAALREMLGVPASRLRALWALRVTGGLDESALLRLLEDGEEHVRSWAVRLLFETPGPSEAALGKFAALAKSDPSGLVRHSLASALQRAIPEKRWDLARALLAREEDAEDSRQALLLWWGVEPLVPLDTPRALALAGDCKIPLLRQFVARRAVAGK